MLTNTKPSVADRLEASRARQAAIRAEAAKRIADAKAEEKRLLREMAALDRRRETQRLCVLGRAWESLGQADPAFLDRGREYLRGYISRDTDREILQGTAWDVGSHDPALAASADQAVHGEGGGHV